MMTIRTALTALLAVPLLAITACGNDTDTPDSTTTEHGGTAEHAAATQTTDADWAPVAEILGRSGKFDKTNTVYRVGLPRTDLSVQVRDVTINPGLSLGGYAAFTKYGDQAMLMGDLVVTEAELPAVTDALQAGGLAQTAVHKHLPQHEPPIWWTHIHGMGDPAKLAQTIKAALDKTGIRPPTPASGEQPPLDLDTAGIDTALGRKGTSEGGVYKYGIARAETVTAGTHTLPAALGLTTAINFQPVGGGRAAINGDFAMIESEIQPVVQALRSAGIEVVEIHNHGLDDNPRLFYMHFWAVDDAVRLSKALRTALDATNLQK
nr:DUF1259 domain-containing protein [Nocardia neocaledoniensis]